MYEMLRFTGKKSRKTERIVMSLYEHGEQSTHEIESLFRGKLGVTSQELGNILKKSGLFKINGHVTVSRYSGSISHSYDICKWIIDYEGLIKKYRVNEFNPLATRSQYIINTDTYELHSLPSLRNTTLWEEIQLTIKKGE